MVRSALCTTHVKITDNVEYTLKKAMAASGGTRYEAGGNWWDVCIIVFQRHLDNSWFTRLTTTAYSRHSHGEAQCRRVCWKFQGLCCRRWQSLDIQWGLPQDVCSISVIQCGPHLPIPHLVPVHVCGSSGLMSAFLNGELERNIWVKSPRGVPGTPSRTLKLRKAMYGLK